MVIKELELNDFRNYESLDIEFDSQTNIIYGKNAQGKTNILEACYMSATTKSHKRSRDRDMIRFGCDEAHIKTVIHRFDTDRTIDIHLSKGNTKKIFIDKIPVKKAAELLGIINIVFFSPEDLSIIKSSPGTRRRFLDVELCQLDKIYLSDLNHYNKILSQRSKLLKDIAYNSSLKDTLDIWDEQLIQYGRRVIKKRQKFLNELSPMIHEIHGRISKNSEELQSSYEADVSVEDFADSLISSREKDLRTGVTNVGPHRDDISFTVDGMDIRKFGSQGQQRTCALSLKLSEINIVKNNIKDNPILLLDDVLSELDETRQNLLLDNISGTQTIITCTGMDEFVKNRFSINRVYEVIKGNVTKKE